MQIFAHRPNQFQKQTSRFPNAFHPPARALQTKLAINTPGDAYEREADRVSEQVMRMPEPQLQRACTCGGECPACEAGEHGRKTDMKDCQWLAELHSKQMLNSGFIPPRNIRELRDYTRLRQDHIEMAAPHILHIQKALDQMNIKIHEVLSDITGLSGQRLIQAIIDGVRNRQLLLALCDEQVLKHKRQRMLEALEGRWQPSQVFALRQAYENWQHYQNQIAACDEQIARVLERLTSTAPAPTSAPCSARPYSPKTARVCGRCSGSSRKQHSDLMVNG